MGAVGHSGITVVKTGWFSLLGALKYIGKPESCSSINFEKGKKYFGVFECKRNNFLCLGVCAFCFYKSLLEQQQQINQQSGGRLDGKWQFPLIKVMSESLEIIQGPNQHILMQLGCSRALVQGSGREEQWIPFTLGARGLFLLTLADLGLGQWPQLGNKGKPVQRASKTSFQQGDSLNQTVMMDSNSSKLCTKGNQCKEHKKHRSRRMSL